MKAGPLSLLPAALAILALAGCKDPEPPPALDSTPESATLALLEAQTEENQVAAPWAQLFTSTTDDSRVELLEAIDAIPVIESAQVTHIDLDPDGLEAYVDLEALLPGGGMATFSARLRAESEAQWRIIWFQGPALEWPIHRAKGEGLTQSAPPGSPTR